MGEVTNDRQNERHVPLPGETAGLFGHSGELARLLVAHDWTGFPLGAPERWPESVRNAVEVCLGSRSPMAVLCGPELALIYNDAYVSLLGPTPPGSSLGEPFRQCWPETWPAVGHLLTTAFQQGESGYSEDLRLYLERDGFREERYLIASVAPLRDDAGNVAGLFCGLTENTRRVVAERRLATLSSLATSLGTVGDRIRICAAATDVFGKNLADLPFGVIYLLDNDCQPRPTSSWGAAPEHATEPDSSGWPVARALTGREPITAHDGEHRVILLPLASGPDAPIGVLACAVSSRQQLTGDYQGFFRLVAQHLGTALASAWAPESVPRPGSVPTTAPATERAIVPGSMGSDETFGARVLVADDDADAREYLRRELSPYWAVETVPDGKAALASIHKSPPELVLADVWMPGLDGFKLLSTLRGAEATADLPVILLSARGSKDATVEGLEAGADDYLVKPFTAAELVARVRTHLSTLRLRQRLTHRLRELADASHALTTSLNTEEICQVVADLVVPERAWWCVIWLVRDDEDGQPRITGHYAVPEPDSEDARRLRSVVRRHGELAARLLGADTVLYSGSSAPTTEPWPGELLPLRDGETATLPMMARRRLVGAITFGAPRLPDRDSPDGAYLRELAKRAALAFDNAALYEAEQRITLGLQRSLLPARLPSVPGLRFAARYLPGERGARVGGDWYDTVDLPDQRVGLSVGDVVGQGIAAAASMGQLRTALRSYAVEDGHPVHVLGKVDAFLQQAGDTAFATCLYGAYDPASGRLWLANAGHLTPWLLIPGQPPTGVEIGAGVPLGGASALLDGSTRGSPFASCELTLPPGGALLLHTDGLVEAHRRDLDEELARLRTALDQRFSSPDDVCDQVLSAMAVDEYGNDDTTLLVLMRE
ncbi:MAG: SpoIIE family protein phosphatase [Pseudonocardiaceae bacterium]|nr:SpoIIE family protein phosphatase [Pseudonocardiaceae bacterium]